MSDPVGPFVVADGGKHGENRFRTMKQGMSAWTLDIEEALQFARRKDAETFAAEDEDAWLILPVPKLQPSNEPRLSPQGNPCLNPDDCLRAADGTECFPCDHGSAESTGDFDKDLSRLEGIRHAAAWHSVDVKFLLGFIDNLWREYSKQLAAQPPRALPDLDGEEFYNLMQLYRHAPQLNQPHVIEQFENVKAYLRASPPPEASLAIEELKNLLNAKRFDRDHFANDAEFIDWALNRARYTLGLIGASETPSKHPDEARMDWLNEQPVHFIELDDFSIIDVRGLDVRKAVDEGIEKRRNAETKSVAP